MMLRALSFRRFYPRSILPLVLSLMALLLVACGPAGEQQAQPPPGDGVAAAQPDGSSLPTTELHPTTTPELVPTVTPTVDPCTLQVEVVDVISTGGGITGQGIMQLVVQNPREEDATARIAPGCYFAPPAGSGQQRMMVLQESQAVVPAGGSATLDPYVACIDADAAAPEEGADYTFGGMVPDPTLQQFAECLAKKNLPQDMMTELDAVLGLQFAVWQASGGFSMAEDIGGITGAGGQQGDGSVSAMMVEMMSLLGDMAASSQEWLDACGIDPTAG